LFSEISGSSTVSTALPTTAASMKALVLIPMTAEL
jgi:hypothetical protein